MARIFKFGRTGMSILLILLMTGSVCMAAGIPAEYKTGQWLTYPTEFKASPKTTILLNCEPEVKMIDEWKAEVTFTTAIPTPAVTIYYGVYDANALLPWPRFRGRSQEKIEGTSDKHKLELDLATLTHSDISGMEEKGGGVVVYRLEIHSPGTRFLEAAVSRFYDRRFEFYKGKVVPTVIEGPFVDCITETGAIISWETDKPVNGTVKVEGAGDFKASGDKATHFEVELKGLKPGATHNYTVEITDGESTTHTKQYYFRTPAKNLKKFNFAVMGDSRGGSLGGGERDYNGVNAIVFRNILTDSFKRGAEFIVHTGDMITGYTSDPLDFRMQLQSHKDVLENVGHFIPFYEMMGNHEVVVNLYLVDSDELKKSLAYYPMLMLTQQGENSAEKIFAEQFVNPANGPEPNNKAANAPDGKSMPPYKENVYYFDYGNCRYVVMNNNYWYSALPEKYGGNLEGYILDDQRDWLIDLFKKTKDDKSIDHLFLFAQEPLFPNGGQGKTGMWYMGGDPEKNGGYDRKYVSERRDEIWAAFVGTGKAISGNFGDEHNYSRALVTKDRNGKDFEHPAWHLVSGGVGAPYASQQKGMPWSDGVKKFATQLHYTFYKVDGKKVTLETYNIDGYLIDSVELTKDIR